MTEKKQQSVSDQLERLGLRTMQGESGHAVTPSKWAAIITAIMQFQNDHAGRSPANPLIAQATGMSPGQVQYHLAEMEKRGLIIDREGWPRRLIVRATAKAAAQREQEPLVGRKIVPKAAPNKEEEVMENTRSIEPPTAVKEKSGRKRRESFLVNAKRFAQVLTNFYDTHGHAPLIKDMAPQLGYNLEKPVGISRVVKEMVVRGWLYHKPGHHGDFVLTGLGRAVLFGEPLREEVHTDMPVQPQQTKPQAPVDIYRQTSPMIQRHVGAPTIPQTVTDNRTYREMEMETTEPWPDYRSSPNEMRSPVVRVYDPPKPSPEPKPMPGPEPFTGINLSKVDSVDLVLELQSRGFRISR